MSGTADFDKVAAKYTALTKTHGVCFEQTTKDTAAFFENGNLLFAAVRLGEAEGLRASAIAPLIGVLPMPKWLASAQGEYHTPIDDRAELGCILDTARAFSAASALLQFLNEESANTVRLYYSSALGLDYDHNANDRAMLDLLRATTDVAFEHTGRELILEQYGGGFPLTGIDLKTPGENSIFYIVERDAYTWCLETALFKLGKVD